MKIINCNLRLISSLFPRFNSLRIEEADLSLPTSDRLSRVMTSSRAERLNRLFENDFLPPPPDPSKPHLADSEMICRMKGVQPAALAKSAQPAHPAHPCQSSQSAPPTVSLRQQTRATPSSHQSDQKVDLISSSDDDEYVRAFGKPRQRSNIKGSKAKATTPVLTKCKMKCATGSPVEPQAKLGNEESGDNDVSNLGNDGIRLIGKYCPFLLVTRFCYKYMNDPKDLVSKQFFAAGKIWNRSWHL
jgi:hypothetical protein